MLELKQIQYFVACVQTGSFSGAAEILYTTQPSVSRVVKSMEEELGMTLFERYTKGISLTAAGEGIYENALQILDNIKVMTRSKKEARTETLRISTNPSSWFADVFLDYYKLHKEENLHYRIYSLGTNEMVRRLQEREDDIGFVYVLKNQLSPFLFFLSRNYLEFSELSNTEIQIHAGKLHPCHTDASYDMSLNKLRLVQRFPDEFSPDNYWDIRDEQGNSAAEAETVVVTNSDYIMNRLLNMSELVNISGSYLTAEKEGWKDGIPLRTEDNNKIVFGYIRRKGEELPGKIQNLLVYVKERLE